MTREVGMTVKLAAKAVEILESLGEYESSVYEGYSGRAMYGEKVTAIVTKAPPVLLGVALLRARLSEVEDDDLDMSTPSDLIAKIDDWMDESRWLPRRSDNMGLSMVYY